MKTVVLLVMAADRRSRLIESIEACGIEVLPAEDCQQARRILRERAPVSAVMTAQTLKDGCWLHVMEELVLSHLHAATIVCTPGLWIHALGCGVYSLLAEPRDRQEMQSTLRLAAETWTDGDFVSPEIHGAVTGL